MDEAMKIQLRIDSGCLLGPFDVDWLETNKTGLVGKSAANGNNNNNKRALPTSTNACQGKDKQQVRVEKDHTVGTPSWSMNEGIRRSLVPVRKKRSGMDRVYAALERDPDVDVETVLSDALDADAGFRAMLARFAERASDAVVFMATSGGPGTALAVDDLLLEGAVRLHEAD